MNVDNFANIIKVPSRGGFVEASMGFKFLDLGPRVLALWTLASASHCWVRWSQAFFWLENPICLWLSGIRAFFHHLLMCIRKQVSVNYVQFCGQDTPDVDIRNLQKAARAISLCPQVILITSSQEVFKCTCTTAYQTFHIISVISWKTTATTEGKPT